MILSIPGVIRIVGVGKYPIPVADSEVDAIRLLLAAGLRCVPCQYLKSGDRIQVTRGPLRGLNGLVVDRGRDRKLVVSVTLLQRSVMVSFDECWLAPLTSSDYSMIHVPAAMSC
jgi:transcription antitermination factor NusG